VNRLKVFLVLLTDISAGMGLSMAVAVVIMVRHGVLVKQTMVNDEVNK
jgi:hypothetical protein